MVFLVEHAPEKGRAFTAIWGAWGATAGILLGSGVGDVLASLLTEEQIATWGWRLPFLMGGLVAGTGYLIRRSIHADIPSSESKSPILESFGKYRKSVIQVFLLNIGFGVGFYTAFVYAVTYIKEIDKLPERIALNLNTESMALLLIILPAAAWLSDRFGRKPLLIAGSGLLTFGAIPLFHLLHTTDPLTIFFGGSGIRDHHRTYAWRACGSERGADSCSSTVHRFSLRLQRIDRMVWRDNTHDCCLAHCDDW